MKTVTENLNGARFRGFTAVSKKTETITVTEETETITVKKYGNDNENDFTSFRSFPRFIVFPR